MTTNWLGLVIMMVGTLAGAFCMAWILMRSVRAWSWWPIAAAFGFIVVWATGLYWAVWFGADRGWW